MGVKILHITLSFLLFISTSGIEINSHFCCGKYKYSSLYLEPENCCKKVSQQLPLKDSCSDEFNKTPCCQNKASFVKSIYPQNHYSDISQKLELQIPNGTFSGFTTFITIEFQKLDIDYLNYKPPLIRQNFTTLFQVFRC